jgi:hypothetical protein
VADKAPATVCALVHGWAGVEGCLFLLAGVFWLGKSGSRQGTGDSYEY